MFFQQEQKERKISEEDEQVDEQEDEQADEQVDGGEVQAGDAEDVTRDDEEEEETRIDVTIPYCRFSLGSELYFVKMPNFLSIERKPFDPSSFEDEMEEDEVLDEEGRARLKLKVSLSGVCFPQGLEWVHNLYNP